MQNLLKQIPKVDRLLEEPKLAFYIDIYRQEIAVVIIREVLETYRQNIQTGKVKIVEYEQLIAEIAREFDRLADDFIKPVVNGTGVILNTGLGRAPLSESAIAKANLVMNGFCSLEFDIPSGKRGRREDKVSRLVSLLTGAEAATVVNNNAAAVMICLNTLAEKKEVIISRAEQVEIGGAFRMPDIIKKSGCKMVEVGTTNKTYASDYQNAVSSKSGLLLKVHTSNYKVVGFVQDVSIKELAEVKTATGLPFYYDLGGGALKNLTEYGLPYEPLVQDALKDGADLVSFSGDKVLGGPQCGIIAGKKSLIEKIKKNPLMRILRTDKIRLALLEETLKLFLSKNLQQNHRTLELLTATADSLKLKAEELSGRINALNNPNIIVLVVAMPDEAGSGTLPSEKLAGYSLQIAAKGYSAEKLSRYFRTAGNIPVVGYINEENFFLSMRAIGERDFEVIVERIAGIK